MNAVSVAELIEELNHQLWVEGTKLSLRAHETLYELSKWAEDILREETERRMRATREKFEGKNNND